MSIITIGKKLFNNNAVLIQFFLKLYNRLPFNNRIRIKGKQNVIKDRFALLKHSHIFVKGNNNHIIIGKKCTLRSCKIYISGSNNTVELDEKVAMLSSTIHIENDNNIVSIGKHTQVLGATHLACIEGTKITIGERCLFSSDVTFRTGDSHAILDMNGNRINASKDIVIADHVWFGNKSTIAKGVQIMQDSIIAMGAIVTKSATKPNVVLGGSPAKIIKTDINWDINR